MYNDKYRWQFCCTSARSSSTQCGLQVGVGLAGNYVSCIFFISNVIRHRPRQCRHPLPNCSKFKPKNIWPIFWNLENFQKLPDCIKSMRNMCRKNFRIIFLIKTIRSDRTGIISSLPNYRKSFHVKTYPMKSSNSKKYKTTPPPVWRPTWHSIPASRLPRPHRRRRPVRDQPSSCGRPPGPIDR